PRGGVGEGAPAPLQPPRRAGRAHRFGAHAAPGGAQPVRRRRLLVPGPRAAPGPRPDGEAVSETGRRRLVLAGLAAALPLVLLLGTSFGSVPLPFRGILGSLVSG